MKKIEIDDCLDIDSQIQRKVAVVFNTSMKEVTGKHDHLRIENNFKYWDFLNATVMLHPESSLFAKMLKYVVCNWDSKGNNKYFNIRTSKTRRC
jgi:hypothetical protein